MGIKHQTLEAIKAFPISELASAAGLNLKKVGHEYVTLCPWHTDTNPSLTINDDKGFCFCHVCRSGGDGIELLRGSLGLTFSDAAEKAANIANIPFERDNEDPALVAQRKAAREKLIAGLEEESRRYQSNLMDPRAERIRQILKDRGIKKEAAIEFGLGFAPSGEFGGRITIPIADYMGSIVGFSGRATGDIQPKYKNSSTSELFEKKGLVFNENRARAAAREAGCLIFVEGHLDVVSMWQAGIKNVVAIQGTAAPDPKTLKRLAKASQTFILCYDGDAGGTNATRQFIMAAGQMAADGEISIKVASLPEGQDPDDVLRSGGNLYNIIANAPPWLDWLVDSWVGNLDLSDSKEVIKVEKALKGLINRLRSQALRNHYIDRAARVLTRNKSEADTLAQEWVTSDRTEYIRSWRPRSPDEARRNAEIKLVRLYIHRPEKRPELRDLMMHVTHPPLVWLCNRLLELKAMELVPANAVEIVAVAEPHFMQQLRKIVKPNVIVDDRPEVIANLRGIISCANDSECDSEEPTLSLDQKSA